MLYEACVYFHIVYDSRCSRCNLRCACWLWFVYAVLSNENRISDVQTVIVSFHSHALANIRRFHELISWAGNPSHRWTHTRARARARQWTHRLWMQFHFRNDANIPSASVVVVLLKYSLNDLKIEFIYSLHSEHPARWLNVWGSAHFYLQIYDGKPMSIGACSDRPNFFARSTITIGTAQKQIRATWAAIEALLPKMLILLCTSVRRNEFDVSLKNNSTYDSNYLWSKARAGTRCIVWFVFLFWFASLWTRCRYEICCAHSDFC